MRIRAVIFDLYGTLLEFGPPPADAATRWAETWRTALDTAPRLSLGQFDDACRGVVAIDHATARTRGIAFPEVFWPDIVDTVLPEFAALPAATRSESPVYGASFLHTVRLMPGVADALRAAHTASLRLGLASNCQPYSLRELDDALTGTGLTRDLFEPRLSFLSFEHGFSKPDPHVFQFLDARLRTFGITPGESLMVGDRVDNDLEPARAHGWQTAWIGPQSAADWRHLQATFFNS